MTIPKRITSSDGSPQRRAAIDLIRYRKQTYQSTFEKDNADNCAVLADLARFCRAGRSTFDADARVHALLEGRKEVFLRIAHHLGYTEDELYAIYVNGSD